VRIETENAAAAESDLAVTVVGVQEVQIVPGIRSVVCLKKIAHRGTSIGTVEATVQKAKEKDIKEDHRLATLSKAEKWQPLQERVVETGSGSGTLVDVMAGSVRVDEKFMTLDGRVTEQIEGQRGLLVVETEMGGQILEVTSVERVADERTEGESDAAVRT
jgi:hypothetical protein